MHIRVSVGSSESIVPIISIQADVPDLIAAEAVLGGVQSALLTMDAHERGSQSETKESIKAGLSLAGEIVDLRKQNEDLRQSLRLRKEQINAISDTVIRTEQEVERWKQEAKDAGSTHPDFEHG